MPKLPVLDSTIQKTHEWLKEITDRLGFPNEKSAFAALRAVLHALRDRLPQQNAARRRSARPARGRATLVRAERITAPRYDPEGPVAVLDPTF